ncbi:putative FMN-binding domain protein [Mycobacterium xenopi 3993]|nr:putative FMN-binding domain protein [Mycobacterium xenopi 3993]
MLQKLYQIAYLDEVRGCRRLFLHGESRLSRVEEIDGRVVARFEDRFSGESHEFDFDGAVLATGYDRVLDAEIFREVLPHVLRDESGEISLSRSCRVNTGPALTAGLFLQGYGEASFGIGDTLLSLLPFRAQAIAQEIAASRHRDAVTVRQRPVGDYPPKRYLETDPDRLRAVIERYRFATLISARATDEPVVTQLPLTLDTSRGHTGCSSVTWTWPIHTPNFSTGARCSRCFTVQTDTSLHTSQTNCPHGIPSPWRSGACADLAGQGRRRRRPARHCGGGRPVAGRLPADSGSGKR